MTIGRITNHSLQREERLEVPYRAIREALYRTTWLENWGTGAKRIIDACREQGIEEPTWRWAGGIVYVTFKRPSKSSLGGEDHLNSENDPQAPTKRDTSMTQSQNLGGESAPSTPQVPPKHPLSTPQVEQLIANMSDSYLTLKEIAELCGIKDLKYFRESYIAPSLEAEVIERLYPNQPKHPKQKYRQTTATLEWKASN